jgi:peptide/nickel transport system ATP-binding protein
MIVVNSTPPEGAAKACPARDATSRHVVQRPQHPYTRGLMGSIPKLGARSERLTQIEGSMPRLNAIPGGCAFHPRCPKAFERCPRERPELLPAGASRAACWLHAPAEAVPLG